MAAKIVSISQNCKPYFPAFIPDERILIFNEKYVKFTLTSIILVTCGMPEACIRVKMVDIRSDNKKFSDFHRI